MPALKDISQIVTEKTKIKNKKISSFDDLLKSRKNLARIPKVGDIVKGEVVGIFKNEVFLDVNGLTSGIVRGKELYSESERYKNLHAGDVVEAMVIDLENEDYGIELSFRAAGKETAWANLHEMKKKGETLETKIIDVNKGGLLTKIEGIDGFIPVSQLTVEYYPRVSDGDKKQILNKLQKLIGKTFHVKIIDVDEEEEKLILSQKATQAEERQNQIQKLNVGDTYDGKVAAVMDFGIFVRFSPDGKKLESLERNNSRLMEGLVHISEISWDKIDNVKEMFRVGDDVKVMIIGTDGSRIALSMKRLEKDPWIEKASQFQLGNIVDGEVVDFAPYGAFVKLSDDIQGLAHASAFVKAKHEKITKYLEKGQKLKFTVLEIVPDDRRISLGPKNTKEKTQDTEKKDAKKEKKTVG